MANTRATCIGHRKSSDTGEASRLGSEAVSADVATWRLRCDSTIRKDESGHAELRRINGGMIASLIWRVEDGQVILSLVCNGHDPHHYTAEA
jgi:hypothetical protein